MTFISQEDLEKLMSDVEKNTKEGRKQRELLEEILKVLKKIYNPT